MGKSWKQWLPLQIPLNNVYISVFLSQWFKLLFISAVILQPGECESTTLGHKISHKISQGEMILLDLLFLTKKILFIISKWNFKQRSSRMIMKIKFVLFVITVLKCESYRSYALFHELFLLLYFLVHKNDYFDICLMNQH